MQYRPLGSTGLTIANLAFGCGPVSGLMTGNDFHLQLDTVREAVNYGIDWFDTAPGYGQGKSEEILGEVLRELGVSRTMDVATKVRLAADQLGDIRSNVLRSFEQSLERLGTDSVTMLQLHNSITFHRDDEPTSITSADVLGPNGVLAAFQELKQQDLIRGFGLTGIGQPKALREVIRCREFDSIQMPYHLLNPSAGRVMPADFVETNYDKLIDDCVENNVSVLAIRVFAGGALLDHPPSAHTLKTPFFPLDLYERDRKRAERLRTAMGDLFTMQELALRFVLNDERVTSAIIGFANPQQVQDAVRFASRGPIPDAEQMILNQLTHDQV